MSDNALTRKCFKYIHLIAHIVFALNMVDVVSGQEDGGSSCLKYGKYYKGSLCMSANGLEWWQANSWLECRERCKSNLFTLIPCKMFSWDSNGGMCTLQNGDSNCVQNKDSMVTGYPDTKSTGSCATTCTVGEWSSWSSTCIPNVYGGVTYRTRQVASQPMYPLEKCPHIQEVENCSDRNWGAMSSTILSDENSALKFVLNGYVDQKALSVKTSTNGCPNYDVGILGWGCVIEDDLNYSNMVITTSYTWQDCLNRCKQNSSCRHFNFRTTGTSTSPCYLILGEIGCSFHSIGWISGSKELDIKYGECDISCVLGEWSGWSGCNSAYCIDGKAYSKRSRPVITYQRGSGAPCGRTNELQLCNDSYICKSNKCIVGSWSEWSKSSDTPSNESVRRRTIQKIPTPGGTPCPPIFEIVNDDKSSDWGSWSSCSVTCGGGFRTRSKSVANNSTPLYSTESCNSNTCDTYKIEECKNDFGNESLNWQLNRYCLISGFANTKDELKILSDYGLKV
ncbi:TSP1 domain-containing TSP3 precursor [Cryptosporidium bovis]|uniref:TSP1 domain-containing TSP3 precursor n=1 Tax=Cryptosporidium bovis TaxID=310047 RepID=UPI00351A3019|nr:TSP1 domain-containing TSP3 precursor [Cryptosporidium bovis]